jgi:hypothetical protein
MKQPLFLKLLMLSALLTPAACTRPQEDNSNLSIKLPQQMLNQKGGTLSVTESLAHVVINVTGPGIDSPILLTWDGHHDGGPTPTPPEFKLEVPQGDGRLVQVLAIYQSSEGSSLSFFYGDAAGIVLKSNTTTNVPVTVTSIGQGNPIISGTIWGRYLTAVDTGPTGELAVRYNPGAGKPSLLVQESMIANGWFEVPALSGASLEYVTDSGVKLFDGPVSLEDPRFNPAPATENLMRISIPVHSRNDNYSGGNDWRTEEPQVMVFGWFGSSALISAKKICRPSTGSTLARLAKYLTGASPTDPRSTMLSGAINPNPVPTAAELLDLTSSSYSNFAVLGGASGSPCASPVEYVDKISLIWDMLDGQGRDGASPFFTVFKRLETKGPFRLRPQTPAANVTRIEAEFLPTLGSLFDKMTAYKRVGAGFEGKSETLSCRAMASGKSELMQGFIKVAESGQSTSVLTSAGFNLDIPLTPADVTAESNILICGSLGPKVYERGLFVGSGWLSTLAYVPSQLGIKLSPAVPNSSCEQASVESLSMFESPASGSTSLVVALTKTGSGELFQSTDVTCTSPQSSLSLTIPGNTSSAWFRFKGSGIGTITTLTATSTGVLPQNKDVKTVSVSAMSDLMLNISGQMVLNQNFCKEVVLKSKNSFGSTVTAESGGIEMTTQGALSVHPDATCTGTPILSSSLTAGQRSVYVKSSALGSGQIVFRYTSADAILFVKPVQVQTVPTSSPTKIVITTVGSIPYTPGTCYSFSLHFNSDFGTSQLATGTVQLWQWSAGGGSAMFYSDSSCISALANNEITAANTSFVGAYVKFTNPSASVVNASTSANLWLGSALISGAQLYSVDPP